MNRAEICAAIQEKAPMLCKISDDIWDRPELAFEERFAAEALCAALEKEGFEVERGIAGMETAFLGRYGKGKPVIGFLGEYDALSGMSQKADVFEATPLAPGEPGHGCGHNLLGVGSLAAAIGVKEYLKATGASGTIVYFGCPGEEGGSGKAFMAREGVFNELDCALAWHPGANNAAPLHTSLANQQMIYRFKGVTSHAAASPDRGRSALDALTLMNTGVQFLREHIPEKARLHYAVLDAGGTSPNVVQAEAAAIYLIRMPKVTQLAEIVERVNNVARGAALMTGTTVEIELDKMCANIVPNKVLCELLTRNLNETPPPEYTAAELAYAEKMRSTIPGKPDIIKYAEMLGPKFMAFAAAHENDAICNFAAPMLPTVIAPASSTDVGDVSWNCPCGQMQVTTMCSATPGHSWQRTAQGKSSVAHKGMLFAGSVLAASAIELLEKPELVEAAREEWKTRLGDSRYIPMPPEVKPGRYVGTDISDG